MGLIKCPRCELNYMLDTDKLCSICRREVRGESETDEVVELCSECGENPVVPGQELCAACLKDRASSATGDDPSDEEMANATNIGIDSVSSMDEIKIGIDDDDIDDEDFDEEDLDGDDDLDDEDDE